jgi:hypothetical protein
MFKFRQRQWQPMTQLTIVRPVAERAIRWSAMGHFWGLNSWDHLAAITQSTDGKEN